MTLYYDREGRPLNTLQWSALFENLDYRRVAQTVTQSGARVSTIWLGLDHSFGTGPPVIFETMVFHDGEDFAQDRYATEAEARAGHDRYVAQFGGPDPNPPIMAPEARGEL